MSVTQDAFKTFPEPTPWWRQLGAPDWLWALLVAAAAGTVFVIYAELLGGYETGILFGAALALIGLGWYWKPLRWLSVVVATLSLFAIWRYGVLLDGEIGRALVAQAANTDFWLRFLFASQSAVMWMSALFVMATVSYFIGLFAGSSFAEKTGSALTWSALAMGLIGLMVRWRESYLINPEFGHIPVSNLYEVFILFCIITALIYLYYEGCYRSRAMGGFVLLVISAAVGFLLWYSFDRGAHEIEPLVPALKSYWMKIHVPANFIGYGAFALASMVGVAYLLRARAESRAPDGLLAARLPGLAMLDDVMYKSIALGFAFFTIATILGAMWAAEAWGGYWSWDPKETWALIVWLNYAAWLHMRLTKGWRGVPMAWWSIVGLFVTLFAFLGVNMFLSGLHSYGEL